MCDTDKVNVTRLNNLVPYLHDLVQQAGPSPQDADMLWFSRTIHHPWTHNIQLILHAWGLTLKIPDRPALPRGQRSHSSVPLGSKWRCRQCTPGEMHVMRCIKYEKSYIYIFFFFYLFFVLLWWPLVL